MPNNTLSFTTNNVKGIQSSTLRLKLIHYLKDKRGSNGILFVQEIHSDSKFEQRWKEDFKGQNFFSHGKSNAYGILTAYFGVETFTFKKQQTDKEGRILILDVSTNHSEYILISLYNANTEEE